MLWWRRVNRDGGVTDEESIDVVARLHPYEELFNDAMAVAARFAEERDRRDPAARPSARLFGRRAS